MVLKKIIVENFRNIKHAEMEFSPNANIFFGDNAQGKTNLLEAVSVALGKSFRNARGNSFTPFNNPEATTRIRLSYESESVPNKINEIDYQSNQEKTTVKINEIPFKKANDLYGEFKYVVFIPDNLNLIKGYPDVRRSYLDNIAIMQNKSYREFLTKYKDALKQRCTAYISRIYDKEILSVWDDILIKQGINLTYGRLKYLNLISKYTGGIYKKLSGGERISISYFSDVFGKIYELDASNKENLYGIYKRSLNETVSEGQSGRTPGAHRDDVVFFVKTKQDYEQNRRGFNARSYASQGQLRSIAVSLKLAEAGIIRNFNRENPVVLLDEVLGELDSNRRSFIIKHFDDSQVFITSCNVNDFKNIPGLKMWRVKNGEFVE
ncbi:MAG: DNA replication and repair protein RecF [Oscillospiraceae bacterium]|nr:DNA replication and repair protein RecF [Oscillospiraceae bacterium]